MSALITIIRNYWIFITLLLLAAITLLSLIPLPSHLAIPGNDKTHHFIAYCAVTLSLVLKKPKYWLLQCFCIFVWSGIVELFQPFVKHSGDWQDMAANAAGIMCGLLLGMLINRIYPVCLIAKIKR